MLEEKTVKNYASLTLNSKKLKKETLFVSKIYIL